jgi:hypothetical protein
MKKLNDPWKPLYMDIKVDTNLVVDTGFRCSVCFNIAQVLDCGQSLCLKHAKEWDHGYGKTLLNMQKKKSG